MGAGEDEDDLALLEEMVPSSLQMAAEAAVLLQGVGQFVEDDDSPAVAHSLRQHLERLLPITRLDGYIALAAMLPAIDSLAQVAQQQVAGSRLATQ